MSRTLQSTLSAKETLFLINVVVSLSQLLSKVY